MSQSEDYADELSKLSPQKRGSLKSFLNSDDEVLVGVRDALNDMGSYQEIELSDGQLKSIESGILYIETEGKHDVIKRTIEQSDFFPDPRKSIPPEYIGHIDYSESLISSKVATGLACLEEIDDRVTDISDGSASNTYEYKLPEEDLEFIKSII